MEYVKLGSSGLKISRICVGCMSFGGRRTGNFRWTLGYNESESIINRAVDLGVNYFDTADVYSEGRSEEILGKVVRGRREDLVIATKVYNPVGPGPNDGGLSRKHIRQGLQRSLGRLGMSYIDHYQIHRWDYDTPIEETLSALDDLVHEGLVHYTGATGMWAWQFATALDTSERLGLQKFVSMQSNYNLVYREEEREMIPLCRARGVALLPWSPLARGFLGGRYRKGKALKGRRYEKDPFLKQRYFTPVDFEILERVFEIATEKGVKTAQVALAWLLSKPAVASLVVGTSTVQHIEEAVQALEVKLSGDEVKRLEEPYRPREIQGHV